MSTRARIEVQALRREFRVVGDPKAQALFAVIKEAEETFGAKVWTWRVVFADAPKRTKVRIGDYHIESGLPPSFPDADE